MSRLAPPLLVVVVVTILGAGLAVYRLKSKSRSEGREVGPSSPEMSTGPSPRYAGHRDPAPENSVTPDPLKDVAAPSHGASDHELLESAYNLLVQRHLKIEAEIVGFLRKMEPSKSLEYLQALLLAPGVPTKGPMTDDRLRRMVAAEYLPWIANQSPALAPAVLALSKSSLIVEQDRFVRLQLLSSLAGIRLQPSAVLLESKIEGAPPTPIEIFSASPSPSSPLPWRGGLLEAARKDGELLGLLGKITENPSDPDRTVGLRVLTELGTDASLQVALEVWKEDPSCRKPFAEHLARHAGPAVVRTFVDSLAQEHDAGVLQIMARTIEISPMPPGESGTSLLKAISEANPSLNTPSSKAMGSLLDAAASVFASTHDQSAGQGVVTALQSPSTELRGRALSAVAKHPSTDFSAAVTLIVSGDSSLYVRELAGYVLGKLDPTYAQPNLFSEIESLQNELSKRGALQTPGGEETAVSADPAVAALQGRLAEKRGQLRDLKKR